MRHAHARCRPAQLYETSAGDPASFTAVAMTTTIAALLACWVPTRRALHIDPIAALREE
jgi:putative ABC transport system permease protein